MCRSSTSIRVPRRAEAGTGPGGKRQRLVGHRLAEDLRYDERSTAERVNAAIKDHHGGRSVQVRGADKVMCHLMFGVLCVTALQLMRLII